MKKILFIVLISIILTFQVAHGPSVKGADSCISGWTVTGYYTPHESDFSGNLIQIQAEGQSLQVKENFIKEIKIEGWGKLETGLYLGWYDSKYHLSLNPLDAHDTPLSETSLAADPNVLPQGIKVTIPSLPSPYDQRIFTISDVGPSIKGKHVDVYTGEGQKALQDTFDITGFNNNTVCVINDQDNDGDGGSPPPTEEFFNLSKNSDFSTDDTEFTTSDTLYMLASSSLVDSSNIKKAEYKIEDSKKNRLKGNLDFNSEGFFLSSTSLASLESGTAKVELKLEDNNRNKFQIKENIIISGDSDSGPPPPTEEFFNLSKNSDFSTDDTEFTTSDTLYMLASSSLVDSSNMKKAEFKIQDSNKVKLQGKLILGADGIFTSSVPLADLNTGTAKVELKLEDNNRNKFQIKENITIS